MKIVELKERFSIPGVLNFHATPHGLIAAEVSSLRARATVYLQGAHLAAWQPAGQEPVLFLARSSDFEIGKPIRGGVPLAFPWFAVDQKVDRYEGKPGPSHGFARIQDWTLTFAAMAEHDLHMVFTLGPTEMSRQLGFDHFKLAYEVTIGESLTLKLTVANEASEPLVFEEAMHTYFRVADVRTVSVTGLEPTPYIDKADGLKVKPAAEGPLTFAGTTDRAYARTGAACVIRDGLGQRTITNTKTNSETTVVWNPWGELPDMGPEEWREMVCVETVNAGENRITLEPGKTHTMSAHITVASTATSAGTGRAAKS